MKDKYVSHKIKNSIMKSNLHFCLQMFQEEIDDMKLILINNDFT